MAICSLCPGNAQQAWKINFRQDNPGYRLILSLPKQLPAAALCPCCVSICRMCCSQSCRRPGSRTGLGHGAVIAQVSIRGCLSQLKAARCSCMARAELCRAEPGGSISLLVFSFQSFDHALVPVPGTPTGHQSPAFDVSYEFTCSELPAFVSLSLGTGTLMCMSMAMVMGSEVSSGKSSCMISATCKGKARYGDVRWGLGVLGQWDFWP